MGIIRRSVKRTAFNLEEKLTAADKYLPGLVPKSVFVESDYNYATVGYTIETDNDLNNQTLIVRVTDIKKPKGMVIQIPGKATGLAFSYKVGKASSGISYDSAKKLLTIPKGTTIEVILKDNYTIVGAEDLYELTL